MSERLKAPLAYRPGEDDDWGVVRDAEGRLPILVRHGFLPPEAIAAHQSAGTDPCRELGEEVARKLNAFGELLAACEVALAELTGERTSGTWEESLAMLRAAIAKAKPDCAST